MNHFIKWLKTPYFLETSIKKRLQLSFFVGSFIFTFLYIFKPFDLKNIPDISILNYALYGAITFFSLIFILLILPAIFKSFYNENTWTIGKQLIIFLLILVVVTTLNWFYTRIILLNIKANYNVRYFNMIGYTFSVGIFPFVAFIYFNEKKDREKFKKGANKISLEKQISPLKDEESKRITIKTFPKNETISFFLNDLIYIKSEGNYVSFFILENDILKELVIRCTLHNIEKQLKEYKIIYRVHRSFMINARYFYKIIGNARGYQLVSSKLEKTIPVSRRFSKNKLTFLIQQKDNL